MAQATLSPKNQIVVPGEARDALGVKAGDKLMVLRGGIVIILQKPKSHQKAISGLARSRYPRGYLRRERRSWD